MTEPSKQNDDLKEKFRQVYKDQILQPYGPLKVEQHRQLLSDKTLEKILDRNFLINVVSALEKEAALKIEQLSDEILVNTVPKDAELKQDGFKTSAIIFNDLRERLSPYFIGLTSTEVHGKDNDVEKLYNAIKSELPDTIDDDEEIETIYAEMLDKIYSQLTTVADILLHYFSQEANEDGDHYQYLTLEESKASHPTWPELLTDFQQWLIKDQRIPSEAIDPAWPMFIQSALTNEQQDAAPALTQEKVYWINRDITAYLLANLTNYQSYWDADRLRFTVLEAYILFVDGTLKGKPWSKKITGFIQEQIDLGYHNPKLIIVMNNAEGAFADIVSSVKGCDIFVVPAPLETTQLEKMAQSFGAEVVNFRPNPEKKDYPAKRMIRAKMLKQTRWATIDRQGITLASPGKVVPLVSKIWGDWRVITTNTFLLPPNWVDESLADVETTIRWGAEMNKGFGPGAGVALYHAGSWLLGTVTQTETTPDNNRQPADELVKKIVWTAMANALQVPTRLLMDLVNEETAQTMARELEENLHQTFKFIAHDADTNITNVKQQALNDYTTVIWGHALDIGLVTPLPQLRRIVKHLVEGISAEIITLAQSTTEPVKWEAYYE